MKKINISLIILFSLVVIMFVPFFASADTLYRQLQVGSRGADVSSLQMFLAADSTIYPSGLVTGYFGALTRAAVMRFQALNGISQVGRVGPQTLAAINAQINAGVLSNIPLVEPAPGFTSPAYVSINGSTATFNVNTNIPTRAVVYYSPYPIMATENDNVQPVTVSASGDAITDTYLQTSHTISSPNLLPNTTYYSMAVVSDVNGVVSVIRSAPFRTN